VRVNGSDSKTFKRGLVFTRDQCLVHYFSSELETMSRELWESLPMELLYANDQVLMAEMEELQVNKIQKWKNSM